MTVLSTQLNPRSAEFAANAQAMQAVVDDLRAHLERIAQGGGEALGALALAGLAHGRRGRHLHDPHAPTVPSRARLTRRRSRSDRPPQIPNRSSFARA